LGKYESIYHKRSTYFKGLAEKQAKIISIISYLRLAAFIIGFGTALFIYIKKQYYISGAVFLIAAGIFIYLIKKHSKVINNKKYSMVMEEINNSSIKRIDGSWKSLKDSGEEFIDENHNYTNDLDIFGRGSLFQLINCTNTYSGRLKLKNTLSLPQSNIEEIYKRQESVKELASKLTWRQKFEAEGKMVSDRFKNPEKLIAWGRDIKDFYCSEGTLIFFRILPVITALVIILTFVGMAPRFLRPIFICIQIILLIPGNKERTEALSTIYEYKKSIITYEGLIKLFEKGKFKSSLIRELQSKLLCNNKEGASEQIKELSTIAGRISDRANFFYIVFNILFLLDYQLMFALEAWKKKHGGNIDKWIDSIAEVEALSSLSVLQHDNPDWVMPIIDNNTIGIEAKAMGHPLLGKGKVCNDLTMRKPASILLITGSNMSGKSTLLRTSGINLVLAYAGAPVCASSFSCSIMDIYTCMRVSDNLEKNISSFYAEILRIKMIVKAVKERKEVFFLLDEIFKGTNSIDRHQGAKILIKQLLNEGAIGMVSTHDLELGELEKENEGRIKNYHFSEYYTNNELKFDYRLKPGISNTRNAMYLIKLAGIDTDKQ
jgi:DNA mismatch repair ATPase MutS